jgi:hypothetical protein
MLQHRPGRPEAAGAVWRWQDEAESSEEEAPGALRRRGAVRAVVAGIVGALVLVFLWRTPGLVILGIAGVLLLAALLSPSGVYATIERGIDALARRTGIALGWVLLVPVFYLFFLPFGLVMRRGRRDRMQRRFEAEASTYWEPRGADPPNRQRLY